MKKILIALGAISSIAVVIIAGGLIYIANFDPNENKDWLARKFNEATGRNLTLGGDLKLTIYPWLGLTLNDVSVSNAEGFSDNAMLQVGHAEVRVKFLPLLNGEYEIDTVRLQGTRVNLETAGNGTNNWDDLSSADASDPAASDSDNAGSAFKNIILGGVAIEDTSLVYDNQSNNTHYEVNNLTMTVEELVYGEPLRIAMSLDALSRKPQLASNVKLDGTVMYDVDNGLYDLSPLTLNASLNGPDVPAGSTDITLSTAVRMNLEEDTLIVDSMELDALDTRISTDVTVSRMQTSEPAVTATLDVAGENLAAIFRILEQDELARRVDALNNAFRITASVAADMDTGIVTVPALQASLLDADVTGGLQAAAVNTDEPSVSGNLRASGPDLPTLVEVIGILQGGRDAGLARIGRELAQVPDNDRAFTLTVDFNADLKEGNIQLPALTAETLGFRLDGKLDAQNMQANNGSINGSLALTGTKLREVLNAVDQPELAEVAQAMSMNLEVSGSSNSVNIKPLKFNVVVAGPDIPNSPQTLALDAETVVNLDNDSISIDNFTLAGLGLNASGNIAASDLSGNMSYEGRVTIPEFNARNILEQLNQEAPITADPTVLQKLAMEMAFNGSANALEIAELALTLDDTAIKGNLNVSDFATLATRFALDIDGIDADRYLPPSTQATASSAEAEETPLDVAGLKELDVQGSVNIGQFTISGLKLTDVVVAMNAKDGAVSLNPVSAALYDGNFKSDMLLSVTGAEPTATVNTTLSSINLGPLLQDFMDATYVTGTGNIQLGLTGQGADITAIKRSLDGNGSISLENGVLAGVNVSEVLGSIETMIRSKRVTSLPQGGETAFDNFSSTLVIQDGIVNSSDLLIAAPGWKVNGTGTLLNLNNDTIDYDLVATVEPATATSNDETFDIGGYALPIACTGNISSPSCLPDAQQIIRAAVTNEVQQRLGDFLQDRLGGAIQPQAAPAQEPAQNAQPEENTEQPPEETPSVEEELINRALDRLFR